MDEIVGGHLCAFLGADASINSQPLLFECALVFVIFPKSPLNSSNQWFSTWPPRPHLLKVKVMLSVKGSAIEVSLEKSNV